MYLNHIIMHTLYVQCAQYKSIEVARPVEVNSEEMYSEVFDALPKGKSAIIVKLSRPTVTK